MKHTRIVNDVLVENSVIIDLPLHNRAFLTVTINQRPDTAYQTTPRLRCTFSHAHLPAEFQTSPW